MTLVKDILEDLSLCARSLLDLRAYDDPQGRLSRRPIAMLDALYYDVWLVLGGRELEEADRLLREARDGVQGLFVGDGVSADEARRILEASARRIMEVEGIVLKGALE